MRKERSPLGSALRVLLVLSLTVPAAKASVVHSGPCDSLISECEELEPLLKRIAEEANFLIGSCSPKSEAIRHASQVQKETERESEDAQEESTDALSAGAARVAQEAQRLSGDLFRATELAEASLELKIAAITPPAVPQTPQSPPIHAVELAFRTAVPEPSGAPERPFSRPRLSHEPDVSGPLWTEPIGASPAHGSDGDAVARPPAGVLQAAASAAASAPAHPVIVSDPDPSHAVATVLLVSLAALVPLLLYHRIDREKLLDSARRREITEYVRAHPGTTAAEVASALGLYYNAAWYQLDRLARAGYLSRRSGRKAHHYFEPNAAPAPEAAARALSALSPENRAFLAEVARIPGATQKEVAARLELAKSTVSRRVQILVDSGLLAREGRSLRVAASGGDSSP